MSGFCSSIDDDVCGRNLVVVVGDRRRIFGTSTISRGRCHSSTDSRIRRPHIVSAIPSIRSCQRRFRRRDQIHKQILRNGIVELSESSEHFLLHGRVVGVVGVGEVVKKDVREDRDRGVTDFA